MERQRTDKKKWIVFVVGLFVCSFGDSMNFKASIGVTPYEAIQQTANYITGIKLGTLAIITNILLLAGQFIIIKRVTKHMMLQLPLCVLQGWLFNVIIYAFFGRLILNYPLRVVFLLGGILLAAIGVGMMVYSDVTVFPLEGFCKTLSEQTGLDFAKCRQGADIVFVVTCVAVSFFLHYPYAIREGTIVATVLFSPLMKKTISLIEMIKDKQSIDS